MKRRVGFLLICSAAVPLVIASVAWACAALATLNLDKRSATPGTTVTGTGKNYNRAYMVTVRFNSRTGPVLWQGLPNPTTAQINPTFTVPNVAPGYYTILATQYDPTGTPVSGTPGRAPLQVKAPGTSGSTPPAAGSPWSSSKPSGPGGSAAPVALDGGDSATPGTIPTLAGVLLSLTLLGGGSILLARSRTSASRPPLSV